MEKLPKPDESTGNLPSSSMESDYTEPAPSNSTPKHTVTKEPPPSRTAPILEGLPPTGKSKNAQHLATLVVVMDFMAVKKLWPSSRVASRDGKIYMCIDPGATGKYEIDEGQILFDGFPVYKILESALEKGEK